MSLEEPFAPLGVRYDSVALSRIIVCMFLRGRCIVLSFDGCLGRFKEDSGFPFPGRFWRSGHSCRDRPFRL